MPRDLSILSESRPAVPGDPVPANGRRQGGHIPGEAQLGVRLPEGSVWPDYAEHGLFGLVGSIARFLDGGALCIPGVDAPETGTALGTTPTTTTTAPVVVLLLIDGLGDAFLARFGAGSHLLAHRRRAMTSVFPSTTASAITTLMTGLPPAAHGLTGWFIRDGRFGGVLAPLPLNDREDRPVNGVARLRRLFPYHTLYQRRVRRSVLVSPAYIADSPFSRRHGRGAAVVPYDGLAELRETTLSAVAQLRCDGGGLVYAYYPVFDAISHAHGCESAEALAAFAEVDQTFGELVDRLQGQRGVELVASADHGFIDSPESMFFDLGTIPGLYSMLESPLWGERRAAFCAVRAGAESEFEAAVQAALGANVCVARSERLLAHGLFGPGPHHRRIHERIGTHALLMAPGWTVWDPREGEHLHSMLGVHGGLSAREMWVPLIHARG